MERINIVIVGAGVVGLAIARELSKFYKDIFVIEKNPSFGKETSSRNSEVIHAGIYYPKGSLKARTCIEGKDLLYEFCQKHNINHKRIGKLIVALDKNEVQDLKRLFKNGIKNGVNDLRLISKDEIKKIEPDIEVQAAIFSASTGILDTHGFMKKLAGLFTDNAGQIAYGTELIGVEKNKENYKVTVLDQKKEGFSFSARVFINCAGLDSDKVAALAGITSENYKLKYSKGDYFRVQNNKARFISHLIYPVPKEEGAGLGIHATLDLGGGLRLGPDDEYVDKINYDVEEKKKAFFYENVKNFLPFIDLTDLAADTSGIRPKLQGPNEGFRDFIIKEESDKGFSGFINLIGIESPGFTSALSIGRLVKGICQEIFREL